MSLKKGVEEALELDDADSMKKVLKECLKDTPSDRNEKWKHRNK